jgi:hypothetical protein
MPMLAKVAGDGVVEDVTLIGLRKKAAVGKSFVNGHHKHQLTDSQTESERSAMGPNF